LQLPTPTAITTLGGGGGGSGSSSRKCCLRFDVSCKRMHHWFTQEKQ